MLHFCTRCKVLLNCCSLLVLIVQQDGWVSGWIGSCVCAWVGVGRGGCLSFPPFYRPRAGIVRRTASFIIIMSKVNNSSQQELLMSCCLFDHVSFNLNIISCDYCCVSFVSLFINLRQSRDFTSHTSRRGTLYTYIYILMCFFGPSAFLSLSAAGLSSCSRLRGTLGARPDPLRKFGLWPRSVARALGVQSGKSARGGIPST